MEIVDSMVRDYLAGKSLAPYRKAWYFTHSSMAGDAGRNIFEEPDGSEAARQKAEQVYLEILEASKGFTPINLPLWDALFPDWRAVETEIEVDLILGFPEPYDAVTEYDSGGVCHIVFDIGCWTKYLGQIRLAETARNLLTHELCHAVLHRAVPDVALVPKEDYLSALDAAAFDEGFAHLISYNGKEIGDVDWSAPRLRETAERSAAVMARALKAGAGERQEFLYTAVCGDYYDKYACMAGMLYLARQWQKGGVPALQACLAGGWQGFAARCIKE